MDLPVMDEVVFEVVRELDGSYAAESDTENLTALGETWEELCDNAKKTVEAYFGGGPKPQSIRLHYVREETIPLV
jgi:predicted RNase H-like HicB family nuclease